MAPLIINDLRGGMSDDQPAKLAMNQVAYAQNVDYWDGWLGGRRNGTTSFAGLGAALVYNMHHHQPTSDTADDRLIGILSDGTFISFTVAPVATGLSIAPADTFSPYHASFASLHGKLFIAADTNVSRLHVFDGTRVRRTGLTAPAAPVVADTGVGTYATTRYFRVRYVIVSGSTVLVRSEPSATTTFTPSGAGLSARVSRPALISESETHWEVEESIDQGNWYRIARVAVATTTYDDSLASTAVASDTNSVLAADIGDYLNLPSARWLTVDDDRLIYAGNFEDAALDARVGWTPLGGATGDGNDERAPLDAGSYIEVDGRSGGKITGLRAFDRKIFVFKERSIHTLVRTGSRTRAYILGPVISRVHGAMPYSIAEGLDAEGNACLYFADAKQGIMRYGSRGLETLTVNLQDRWGSLYRGGLYKQVEGCYHAEKGQFWLNVTQTSGNWPNHRWVLDRFTGGVTFQTTDETFAMVSWNGKPHTSRVSYIARNDDPTATNDVGIGNFRAYIRTRAYQAGSLTTKTASTMAVLEASPHTGVTLTLSIIRDYGVETRSVTCSLTPTAAETTGAVEAIIRPIDNAYLTEAMALQFEIGDASAVSVAAWQLHQLVLDIKGEGRSA